MRLQLLEVGVGLEMRKKEQSPWKQLLLVVAAPLFHLPLPPGNFLLVIKEPFLF